MNNKFGLGIVFILCTVMFFMTGCQKKHENTNADQAASKEPVITEATSSEVLVTADAEVPAINIEELEQLKGIALTAEDKAHSIYRGMFGDEEVILSLWIDKEAAEAQISFVGAYHSDKLSFKCELLEDGIRYQDDRFYILFRQQEDDVLTGYFYESGTELVDVNLSMEAINYSEDKEHLYWIGTNSEVEGFAQKVLDAINGYDMEALSDYIYYPVMVHVNRAMQTIDTKEDFLALGEDVIFTDDFIASMAVAYPNIMFSNSMDGVMLGDGSYNVWINLDENGNLKVTSINN